MDDRLNIHAVISLHYAAAYRYALRLTGRPADAEDVTQQSFVIAHQRLHQVRDPDRVEHWLLTVVRSVFLKTCRERRPLPSSRIPSALEEIPQPPNSADEIDREQLAQALNELPMEFRTAVLMFYFEDLSYGEIAAQLEIPIGTVMSRLSRAKGYLRQALSSNQSKDCSAEKQSLIPPETSGPAPIVGRSQVVSRRQVVGSESGGFDLVNTRRSPTCV